MIICYYMNHTMIFEIRLIKFGPNGIHSFQFVMLNTLNVDDQGQQHQEIQLTQHQHIASHHHIKSHWGHTN